MSDPPLAAEKDLLGTRELFEIESYIANFGAELRCCTEIILRTRVQALPLWVERELAAELDPKHYTGQGGWQTRGAETLFHLVCFNVIGKSAKNCRAYFVQAVSTYLSDFIRKCETASCIDPDNSGTNTPISDLATIEIAVLSHQQQKYSNKCNRVETTVDNPVSFNALQIGYKLKKDRPRSATITIVTHPDHGAIALNPETGIISYQPKSGFTGIDSLQYTMRIQRPTLKNLDGDWRRHLSHEQRQSELSELLDELRHLLSKAEFQIVTLNIQGCEREEIASLMGIQPRRYDALLSSAKAKVKNRCPWLWLEKLK